MTPTKADPLYERMLHAFGHKEIEHQLTIMLTVANNTSSSISNATISLHEPQAGRVVYGQLAGLSLAAGKSTQVNGSFRVPQALYESWQKGSSPAMSVTYSDAQGNPVQTFIQF